VQTPVDTSYPFTWINTIGILNKKKDIFWRLQNNALPLGYRLMHVNKNINGNCPNCPDQKQTLGHFALKCNISKTIWEKEYKALRSPAEKVLPTTIKKIFTASNI
jgi:hypothetical protein